jgi:GrpB-like predicted nucleotidyltransferase (UPF0157 family)
MNINQEIWLELSIEEILIEEYNTVWPLLSAILIRELKGLYKFDNDSFEHIGSTSVPDLPGKPIIDIMLPVDNFDDIGAIMLSLEPENWNLISPELTGTYYQRMFVKTINDKRCAHFYLILNDHPEVLRRITFRDILRQYPLFANEYAQLKEGLAQMYHDDRDGYESAKTDFVNTVLGRITLY